MKACVCALVVLAIIGFAQSQSFASIQDAVATLPELSMLNKNTDAIALADQLRNPNFIGTLFAPTDAALKPLEEAVGGDLTSMLGDPEQVNDVFSTAVIPGQALRLEDLTDGMQLTTLNGNTVTVKITETSAGKVYQINKAYITKANIKAGESIIQEVSSIVVPPEYQDMLDALLPADTTAAKPPVIASSSTSTGTTQTATTPATSTTTPTTSSATSSATPSATPSAISASAMSTTVASTSAPGRVLATNTTQSAAGSTTVGAALLAVPALLAMLL